MKPINTADSFFNKIEMIPYKAKLTERDVLEIRKMGSAISQNKLALIFKTPQPNICRILNKKTWKHL